jgi:hypothetical protein
MIGIFKFILIFLSFPTATNSSNAFEDFAAAGPGCAFEHGISPSL